MYSGAPRDGGGMNNNQWFDIYGICLHSKDDVASP